jgi:hypothetical protein
MWLALALGAAALWGISYTLSEEIYRHISPLTLLAIEFCVSAAVFLYLAIDRDVLRKDLIVLGHSSKTITVLAACIATLVLGELCINFAISDKNATLASLVEISYPIFVALFSWLLLGEDNLKLRKYYWRHTYFRRRRCYLPVQSLVCHATDMGNHITEVYLIYINNIYPIMSFEGPSRSPDKHSRSYEIIPEGSGENFTDLKEQTRNIIQVYRSSTGRIGVQAMLFAEASAYEGNEQAVPGPEIAEKDFEEDDAEEAMNFYRQIIGALKEEAEKETDREKIFAALKSRIEA